MDPPPQLEKVFFYNLKKMVQCIVDKFKCSSFSSFLHCTPRGFLFLASLCLSLFGTAFERMLMSRCPCAMITLSLNRCPHLYLVLFCLIVIVASALHILTTCICQVTTSRTSSQFLFAARKQQLPCYELHMFTFLYKEGCNSNKG